MNTRFAPQSNLSNKPTRDRTDENGAANAHLVPLNPCLKERRIPTGTGVSVGFKTAK